MATSFPRSLAKWSPNLEFGHRIRNGAGSGKGVFLGLVEEIGLDVDWDLDLELGARRRQCANETR